MKSSRANTGRLCRRRQQGPVGAGAVWKERARGGDIALKKGWHPFRLEYFEDFEGQSLFVGFSGEDGKRKPLVGLPISSK
jgi:hypothetical protein